MNLIDAIKSGRPFRRNGRVQHKEWFLVGAGDFIYWRDWDGAEKSWHPQKADILADDWEIQEPTVTITRRQFLAASEPSIPQMYALNANVLAIYLNDFARRLGLEP